MAVEWKKFVDESNFPDYEKSALVSTLRTQNLITDDTTEVSIQLNSSVNAETYAEKLYKEGTIYLGYKIKYKIKGSSEGNVIEAEIPRVYLPFLSKRKEIVKII